MISWVVVFLLIALFTVIVIYRWFIVHEPKEQLKDESVVSPEVNCSGKCRIKVPWEGMSVSV